MELLFKFGTGCRNLGCRKLPVGLMVCLLLTGSGCTSGESPVEYPQGGNQTPIVFRGGDPASRATVTTSVRKIGVFGYSHPGDFSPAATTYIPDYFLNKVVIDKTGANWSYDGVVKYWPDADSGVKLSFFAYAPYIDVENTFILHPTAISHTGTPTISYTVPANITEQIDLLWGNAFNQEYTTNTTNSGVVDFTMNHALTRVDFSIKLDDREQGRPYIVTIKSLTVENVSGSGTLNLSKSSSDASLWTTVRPATDAGWDSYTLTPGFGGGLQELVFDARTITPGSQERDPYTYNSMFTSGQYLMLIPQYIDTHPDNLSPAQVTIAYSFTNVYSGETVEREKPIKLALTTLKQWNPGQGVTYLMQLSLVDGVTVVVDIQGFIADTPWVDVNSTNPVTGGVN